jgi:hypothetical protein
MTVTNTLAYYDTQLIMTLKKFYCSGLGVDLSENKKCFFFETLKASEYFPLLSTNVLLQEHRSNKNNAIFEMLI